MAEDTGENFESYTPPAQWLTWQSKTTTDQKKLMQLAEKVVRAQENFTASAANDTAEELREAKMQFNWHAHAVLGHAFSDAEAAQNFTGEMMKHFMNAEDGRPFKKDGISVNRKYSDDLTNLFAAACELIAMENRVNVKKFPRKF